MGSQPANKDNFVKCPYSNTLTLKSLVEEVTSGFVDNLSGKNITLSLTGRGRSLKDLIDGNYLFFYRFGWGHYS